MPGPLEGVRILDLTRLLPGGYATLLMADLGADVVKLEEPNKGDYIRWTPPIVGEMSAAHIALNRNKRSITLNLKSERGRALSERHPRLIYCAISGYGQDGPRAQVAGHDVNYISYAGALSIMGMEGRRPVIPGLQIGDLAGGGMAAVIAVTSALFRRERTGEGDFCDISMMDGAMSWLTIHAAEFVATGEVPQRELMHLSGKYPCYRVYPAADGFLSVGALEPQFWKALCEAIERPDLLDDAFAMGDRRAEVVRELDELFSTRSRAAWMELFGDRDACVAPVKDFAEAFEDEQVRHRDMVFGASIPGVGDWKHIGNPVKMTGAPGRVDRLPPPKMGEHTAEILGEVGLSEADVAELYGAGVC